MAYSFNPFTGMLDRAGGAAGPPGPAAPATVYADDYSGNLINAINATPAGGRLVLGTGNYTGTAADGGIGFVVERDNITIEGVAMPRYNDAGTALIGGSIVKGPLQIQGDNITIRNLGVDVGPDWAAANPGFTVSNVLAAFTAYRLTANDDPNNFFKVENVVLLGDAPSTDGHCLVVTNYARMFVNNVQTRNTTWGFVPKCRQVFVDGLHCWNHGRGAFHPKSDFYAYQQYINASNIYIWKDAAFYTSGDSGLFLNAASFDIVGSNISNVFISGYARGIELVAWDANGHKLRDTSLSNIKVEKFSEYGLVTYGAADDLFPDVGSFREILLNNISLDAGGRGGKCLRMIARNGVCSNIIASSDAIISDNVYLGETPLASNVISCVGMDKSAPSGIIVFPLPTDFGPHLSNCSGTIRNMAPIRDVETFIQRREEMDEMALATAIKDAYRAFAASLVSDGTWDLLTSIGLPMGANTLDGSLVPLKGPFLQAENLVSGDFSRSTGLKGNGTDKRLVSTSSDDDFTLGSFTIVGDVSIAATAANRPILGLGGSVVGASNLYSSSNVADVIFRNQSNTAQTVTGINTGFMGSRRELTTEFVAYTEATQVTRVSTAQDATGSVIIGVLANALTLYSDGALRFWCWGNGISDVQMTGMRSAYQTMRTAVLAAI